MSTFDVHPRTATPTSISLRSRLLVPAMAVAIALALLIAGVTAATHGASVTSANPLVRPAVGNTQPTADSTPQQWVRPRYPGK